MVYLIFLLLVVQSNACKLLVAFSIFLHSLMKSDRARGSFWPLHLLASLLYELFLAFWYWVAFFWVLQEYSLFLEWHWSLYKMALSPTQHYGSTPLFMSFVFLFQILAFPMWWKASSIRFCVLFFKCPKEHLYSLWFLSWPSVLFYILCENSQDAFPYLGQ